MKTNISVLLICLSLLSQTSLADTIWKEEDGYFGVQFSIPLETGPKSNIFANASYNILLIDSSESYADGFAIGFDKLGFRSLSYLRPSNMLEISQNSVRNHSIRLLTAKSDDRSLKTNVEIDGETIVMYTIGGIILFGEALKDFFDDVESHYSD